MKYTYRCIESCCYNEEVGNYTSYGIEVADEKQNIIRRIEDVSVEKQAVTKLTNLCNSLSVDVSLLDDIIEDFLVDLEV